MIKSLICLEATDWRRNYEHYDRLSLTYYATYVKQTAERVIITYYYYIIKIEDDRVSYMMTTAGNIKFNLLQSFREMLFIYLIIIMCVSYTFAILILMMYK